MHAFAERVHFAEQYSDATPLGWLRPGTRMGNCRHSNTVGPGGQNTTLEIVRP
jgi:hypothetical protein